MHTLLCGQRRYTMPAVVIPHDGTFVDADIAPPKNDSTSLKVGQIKPPGGIIIAARCNETDGYFVTPKITFVVNGKSVSVAASERPTLYLSDSMIESVTVFYATGSLDFVQYWQIEDREYLAVVEEAYR